MISVDQSVILVGMPGAGKSTLGIMLAKELTKDFVDTDVLIQLREGKSLQDIIDQSDHLHLRQLEEQTLLETALTNHVIATGGSVVYSDRGMQHLKKFGPVIFLDVPLEELKQRIHNFDTRGIAMEPGQSFQNLFDERRALYLKYADRVVDCAGKNQEAVLNLLLEQLR